MNKKFCKIDGCHRVINKDGLCSMHQNRITKFGNPLVRTIYDKNEVVIDDDIVTMYIYDYKGVKILETKFNLVHIGEVSKHKWCIKDRHSSPYVVSSINGKMVRLHRFIMNAEKGVMVDHIDGDTLNNLDNNLRIVTQKQNTYNCALSKNNRSGHSGVSWMDRAKKYRAYIMINKKQIHLGLFETIDEAIESRKNAEIKYFNEFSRLYSERSVCSESEE
jgi:hypothetical protein